MKTFKHVMIAFFSLMILASCAKNEKEKTVNKTSKKKVVAVEKKVDKIKSFVITGNDVMKFNRTEIKVKSGQKVKITLKHVGQLPINAMGHNFVILKKGVDMAEFAAKAIAAKENQYIPVGSKDIIAHTKLIGGGESDSVEFDAPEKGTYQFLCSFPGHYGMMKGEFIVE